MNLYEAIFSRKSVRSYEMEAVSNSLLQEIRDFYSQIEGLNPGIRTDISIIDNTTGKTIAFTRRTFVGKVMSLLFNMLSRLVITFLPRSKYLLISWLQSPSAVILEPRKIKSDTVSTVSPSISYEVMGPDAMIFIF